MGKELSKAQVLTSEHYFIRSQPVCRKNNDASLDVSTISPQGIIARLLVILCETKSSQETKRWTRCVEIKSEVQATLLFSQDSRE